MKAIFLCSFLILCSAGDLAAQNPDAQAPEIIKVEPQASKGFSYPYYLYVPKVLRESAESTRLHYFLVIPNNTGRGDDDLAVHEAEVGKRIVQNALIASPLKVALLMPVFPRPKTDWRVYTHALDRDSMVTNKKEYARFDLQLLAMIDDARERLAAEKLNFDRRVLIMGFSASGMFANRFAFLHPDRVKAAIIGSPGGWPISPEKKYKEKALRYPIGTADFKTVSGKTLNLKDLRKVSFFLFMGDQDDNDSVPLGDSYDDEDRELIFPLFGKTPIERWKVSESLYKAAGLNAEFKLYPGVKHTVNPQMRDDIYSFLSKHVQNSLK